MKKFILCIYLFFFILFSLISKLNALEVTAKSGSKADLLEAINQVHSAGGGTVFIPEGLTEEDLDRYHRRLLREFYLRPIIFKVHLKKLIRNPTTLWHLLLKGYLILVHTIVTPVKRLLSSKRRG